MRTYCSTHLYRLQIFSALTNLFICEVGMNKLIEIEGKLIQVLSKTIEINGKEVVTQGEIKILFDLNAPLNQVENHPTSMTNQSTSDMAG